MIAGAAVLGSIISEALAAYVLAEWLAAGYRSGENHAVNAVAFVVVALAAFTVQRVVQPFFTSRRVGGLVTLAASYVVLYGVARVEFAHDFALWDLGWVGGFVRNSEDTLSDGVRALFGMVILTAVWVRTSVRASDDIELETLPRSIGWPFMAVTAVMVLAATTSRSGEVARAGAAFYGVAVLALACSQLALSGATFGELRAGGTTAVLLAATAAVTGACVVVFWIVFGLVGPRVGPPLGDGTEFVLTILLWPPAWLLEQLLKLIPGGGNPFANLPDLAQTQADNSNAGAPSDASNLERATAYGFRALALLFVVAVAAVLVVWLTRFRRRTSRRVAEGVAGGAAGSLGEDARSLFGALFRRRGGAAASAANSAALRLYLDVLAKAERAGQPRAEAETPSEYAPRLSTALRTPVTDEITAVFEQARYAGREPDEARLAELRRRWEQGL